MVYEGRYGVILRHFYSKQTFNLQNMVEIRGIEPLFPRCERDVIPLYYIPIKTSSPPNKRAHILQRQNQSVNSTTHPSIYHTNQQNHTLHPIQKKTILQQLTQRLEHENESINTQARTLTIGGDSGIDRVTRARDCMQRFQEAS